MRDDYHRFVAREAEILAVGPDGAAAFKRYFAEHKIPFPGLPDADHRVSNTYGQEVKLLRLGRMPALVVVDREGVLRYAHYAGARSDIPSNDVVLSELDKIA